MKKMKKFVLAGLLSALGTLAIPALADGEMSEGLVRKIDKEQGKVTLKHGEIKNLDMPGMTMVFVVQDKAVLDTVNAGDKVRFKAENQNGKLTVVEMSRVK